jgi:magnesium-transporting ATPase (P-type)
MRNPPRDPRSPLLPRSAVVRSVLSGLLLTIAAMVLYIMQLSSGEAHARSMAIASLHIGYMGLVWIERAALDPGRLSLVSRNPWSWVVWLLAAASYPVISYVQPLSRAFHVTALSPVEWALAGAAGALAVAWRPLAKGAHAVEST